MTASDPDRIRALLLLDPYLHLYELGDLDPFFWPSTRWFVRNETVALLYTAAGSSVLICLARDPEPGRDLLRSIREDLPPQLYSHLSPGLFEVLESRYEAASFGEYQKMSLHPRAPLQPTGKHDASAPSGDADRHDLGDLGNLDDLANLGDLGDLGDLRNPGKLDLRPPGKLDPGPGGARRDDLCHPLVVSLAAADVDEVRGFYARAYPANWFDPRMLETGCYFGIRGTAPLEEHSDRAVHDGLGETTTLLSVAGVHVYSPREQVGVVGNVATLPIVRGRGLGVRVCRTLCKKLDSEGLRVGLNVARNNEPAIRCYRSLGFIHEADYEERAIRIRRASPRESE